MNTTPLRISLRLKPAVAEAVDQAAADHDLTPTVFMQKAIERAVFQYLPQQDRERSALEQDLFRRAQEKARTIFNSEAFDENFTLRVIRALMGDEAFRSRYEQYIETDAYNDKAPLKTPLNMYLGWYIKNAIEATPILDDKGRPKRAFVKGEPIKSYTLLRRQKM